MKAMFIGKFGLCYYSILENQDEGIHQGMRSNSVNYKKAMLCRQNILQ